MKKSRIISLLTGMTLTVGLLAGCGGQKTTDVDKKGEAVTIQFMETLTSPERTEYVKELISDFESKNPDIKVELISAPWEQAHDKIITQIASKKLPDVVEMADNWLAEMGATGAIEDLGPYVDKWEHKDDITPSSLKLGRQYKDTQYILPYGLFIRGMFYRADWLEESNLPVPKTYDELFQTAKKITDSSSNKYGYSFRGGKGAWTQLINILMSQAGKDNYFDENGKSVLRDPKAIQAFKDYCELYTDAAPKDALNWGYNEKVNAFTSNVTGFLMQDSEVIGSCQKTMDEGTYKTAPLPYGKDGNRYLISGNIGFSMFSTSKNKEASWKFISYMMNPEINADWNIRTNTMPVMKAALENEYFSKGDIKAWTDTAADPKTVFFTHPQFLPEWGEFFANESVAGLQNYLLGKKTAEETMNEWADSLEDAYEKYNSK
ncbi:sugar ABC transporter substrate-binding protein [Clostridium sediminicola]|uniref:ABC transporter substrate-binding protein n=1 Tax=Clostridium sediminicola TaxID=3114879 RepID=UPI0031F1F397